MRNSLLPLIVTILLWPLGALSQDARIEDFRIDLAAPQVAAAESRNVRALASQAYLWGLPAFLHFRQSTEIVQARRALAPHEEPFGGWVLLRKLATPADRNNVMPNVDTLYGASYVLLDRQGPVVVSTPLVKDRYFSVALHDAYFNTFDVVGTRTTGGEPANVLVIAPGFQGPAPQGFTRVVRAPTNAIAIFQRVYIKDDSELARVHAIQDAIRLTPLNRWGSVDPSFPRIETPEYDVQGVREIRDPLRFFEIVNTHTCRNPPPADFGALIDGFARAGLGPCARLSAAPYLRDALSIGARDAQMTINALASSGRMRQGWRVPDPNTGKASLDYTGRAVVQITQVASFAPEEAMYFTARQDNQGALLNGQRRYAMTFGAGSAPPVDPRAFWSLTMYDAKDNLLVANEINRYVVRPATPGLTYNADGSLTIFLGRNKPPGAPEGNWLPAPDDDFIVVLRAYMPDESISRGKWFPPGIERLND